MSSLLFFVVNNKNVFAETPRKFIIAKLSVRMLGSASALIIMHPSLRIKRFAVMITCCFQKTNVSSTSKMLSYFISHTVITYISDLIENPQQMRYLYILGF